MKNFLLTLFIGAVLQAEANVIYVTPNGVDNWTTPGSGSQSVPYNLQYGIWASSSGDTLLLQGTFQLTSQIYIETIGLTLGEWGTGAVIEGNSDPETAGFNLLVLKSVSNFTVQDITFQENWGNGARGIYVWGKGNNVTIKNCTFTNIGWSQDPEEVAPGGYGAHAILVLGNKNDGSYTNITVSGNSVSDCITGWSESITMIGNVDTFLIENNTITDVTNIGIDVAGHFSWVLDWDTNDPLDGDLNQARNGVIRNNAVTRALSPIATSAGIYCDGCRNVLIERNIVKESGAGLSIGCEVGGGNTAAHVTVINNIFRENVESGMFLGSSTSEGSENGPSSVDSCVVRNNTFYRNGKGDTSNDYEVFLQNSVYNKLYNNIFFIGDSARGVVTAADKVVSNFYMDYNLFYRLNQSTADLVISAGSTIYGNEHSQYGNPGFSGAELNISTSSRAANGGDPNTTLVSGEVDRDGGVRKYSTTNIDIGAQESASTQSPVTPNFYLTNAIGESGSITTSQAGKGQWHTKTLTGYYSNPVVIVSPLSNGDSAPATVRVKNVTGSSFQYQIDEWDYQNGVHGTETFFFMVLNAGVYELDGGVELQAGNTSVTNGWTSVSLPNEAATVPLVLAQTITFSDTAAVTTRVRYIDEEGFELKVQEEEGNDGTHGSETVSWVAVTEGTGNAGRTFEADGTDALYDHIFYEIYLNSEFDQPMFFAHQQTTNDNNTAALRYRDLALDYVEIKVQEEQSDDSETSHDNEEIGYFVLDSAGYFYGIAVDPGARRSTQGNDRVLSGASIYPNPVSDVLKLSLSLPQPAAARIEVIGLDGRNYFLDDEVRLEKGENLREIPMNHVPAGIAVVRVTVGGKVYTNKVIVR